MTGSIGYFATLTGFAGKAVVMVPSTTPPLINAALHRRLDGAVVTQLICIVVAVLIYLPFVKIASAVPMPRSVR